MQKRTNAIVAELKHHAPFTLLGAATGIICMLLFKNVGTELNHRLFLIFHPAHVVLSAIVTASLFKLYDKRGSLLKIVVIGYLGAIGVATVSDCILPFFGESVLGVTLPTHAAQHNHEGAADHEQDAASHDHDHGTEPHTEDPNAGLHDHDHEAEPQHSHSGEAESHAQHTSVRNRLHLGFIEDWYIVNPAALLGIFIAYFWPRTKFPHAGHVLISTWASSFHVLMNTHQELTPVMFLGVFVVLFIAVWLPCCISDIIFPMLFIKSAPRCMHGRPHAEDPS